MPPMNEQQMREFLTGGGRILKLATLTPEGWPYVIPVWYRYDGEAFILMGRTKSRWVAHIEKDSRVSACVETPEPPYMRVLVEGTAEIADKAWLTDWSDWATEYFDQDTAHRYYEETKHIPRVLVKITPRSMTTWAGGGWHPRYTE